MYLSEQAVSPTFRAAIAALLPELADNEAYWRFTGYLMFVAPDANGELLIPAPLVALAEGKHVTGEYRARDFLQAYQRDVVRLTIKAHTIASCRVVTGVHWPDAVRELLATERRVTGGERVLFSSGVKWRREHNAQERGKMQAEAIEIMQNMGHHPAFHLLNLLNNAAPNRFAAIKKHLPAAHSLVDRLQMVEAERERQHTILRAIEQQAQPFYGPAQRSVRIFALNDSILRLQRDVRKLVTKGWITADLKSAQLAIVAKAWNVPEVTEFLKEGRSIWKELAQWMGLSEEQKPLLKNALYAVVFGAGRDRLKRHFESIAGGYERFKAHKLIRALLLARAEQLKKIRKERGGRDAFGKWIEIQYVAVAGKMFSYDSSRRILALIAQSYELLLLTPVIDLACEHQRSLSLCTWLHDGFTFTVTDKRDRAPWTARLCSAVKEQAVSLNIETELEIS